MDLRSGRRLGSQRHGPSCRRDPGGADRISFLSDDMILLILERLRCIRTAARTGILSRRWRGLWTRLTTDLVFSGVPPAAIEAAISRFNAASPAGTTFQLDIRLPSTTPEAAGADSMLRAAALLSPARVAFAITPFCLRGPRHSIGVIQLPCFQHATSMELDTPQQLTVNPPAAGEFPALETLSISGRIVQIGAWVTRCPRLRVLRAKLRGHGAHLVKKELVSLKDALGSREVVVSLDISTSADLSPHELVYSNRCQTVEGYRFRILPGFHRATSIDINMSAIGFSLPDDGEFSALERLCLLGAVTFPNLGRFVSGCPRLRVLRVDAGATNQFGITVHSTSLQELVLGTYNYEDYYYGGSGIDIVTPKLKKLTMEVTAGGHLRTSVLAPLLEEVSWRRTYTWGRTPIVFGFFDLQSLTLQTAPSNNKRRVLPVDGEERSTWLSAQQLPRTHVLSMAMCAAEHSTYVINPSFAREIEKLPVAEFSVVDIHLDAIMEHVYGGTLLRLLQALPLHGVTKILKVNLVKSETSLVTGACKSNCFCDPPTENWRSQIISLPHLEEVEIKGFKGVDHGFDFLKLIVKSAPKLRNVNIKLAKGIKSSDPGSCAKIVYSNCLAYPLVNFYVYYGCGTLVPPS